jgi:hypothetical protein
VKIGDSSLSSLAVLDQFAGVGKMVAGVIASACFRLLIRCPLSNGLLQ